MNNSDKKRFAAVFLVLCEVFNREISKTLTNIYFQALQAFTIEQVEDGISKSITTLKFFPKPVELNEIIHGGPDLLEDRAEIEASNTLRAIKHIGAYQSVKFDDPVITAVIQQCYGGWIKLCEELRNNEEKWFRRDFVKYYQAYTRQNITYNGHLMGLIEERNERLGHENWIPQPVLIGERLKQVEYKN